MKANTHRGSSTASWGLLVPWRHSTDEGIRQGPYVHLREHPKALDHKPWHPREGAPTSNRLVLKPQKRFGSVSVSVTAPPDTRKEILIAVETNDPALRDHLRHMGADPNLVPGHKHVSVLVGGTRYDVPFVPSSTRDDAVSARFELLLKMSAADLARDDGVELLLHFKADQPGRTDAEIVPKGFLAGMRVGA